MPELPDLEVYLSCLEPRILGRRLEGVRLASPFLVRSFDPPLSDAEGRTIASLERLGKRLVFGLEGDLFLVLHLMIAGRLHWKPPGAGLPARRGLAAFDFEAGTLLLTEAGSKKRASLHVVAGRRELQRHDPGGLEVLTASRQSFEEALRRENRTLKRALTDPRIFAGIGNAYSDEILHAARLSPFRQTGRLEDEEVTRLFGSIRTVLGEWTVRLREEAGSEFPVRVTAFREEMAVHGKFGQPCPVCAAPVQRIVYAENEANYCAGCQTEGRLLADRALSRLLKDDWPTTLEELEGR